MNFFYGLPFWWEFFCLLLSWRRWWSVVIVWACIFGEIVCGWVWWVRSVLARGRRFAKICGVRRWAIWRRRGIFIVGCTGSTAIAPSECLEIGIEEAAICGIVKSIGTEKTFKQVVSIRIIILSRTTRGQFRSIESIKVILFALLFIRKHFVGLRYFSKFLHCFVLIVQIFIRVPFDR